MKLVYQYGHVPTSLSPRPEDQNLSSGAGNIPYVARIRSQVDVLTPDRQ